MRMILRTLELVKGKIKRAQQLRKKIWEEFGFYFTVSYLLSFRGPEGVLIELRELISRNSKEEDFVTIPLYGKVKGGPLPLFV